MKTQLWLCFFIVRWMMRWTFLVEAESIDHKEQRIQHIHLNLLFTYLNTHTLRVNLSKHSISKIHIYYIR